MTRRVMISVAVAAAGLAGSARAQFVPPAQTSMLSDRSGLITNQQAPKYAEVDQKIAAIQKVMSRLPGVTKHQQDVLVGISNEMHYRATRHNGALAPWDRAWIMKRLTDMLKVNPTLGAASSFGLDAVSTRDYD